MSVTHFDATGVSPHPWLAQRFVGVDDDAHVTLGGSRLAIEPCPG
jgi:hypothetical protein